MSLDKTADRADDTEEFEGQADAGCEADAALAAGLMTPVRRAALEALEREFQDLFAPPARSAVKRRGKDSRSGLSPNRERSRALPPARRRKSTARSWCVPAS